MKHRILLADYSNFDMLAEIPYLFSTAGCEVFVFARKDSWLIKNSFYDTYIEAPEEKEAFLIAFEKKILEKEYDWIILGDDAIIRMINESSFTDILFKKVLPISSLRYRTMLSSKIAFSQILSICGISTPDFLIYDGTQDVERIISMIGTPFIIKYDTGEGGTGVFFVESVCEIEKIFSEKPNGRRPILLQEYITGKNISVEALYRDGALLAYATSEVLTTLGGSFGISARRKYFFQKELELFVKNIGEKICLNGFASITILYSSEKNRWYVIEIDMRPQAWFRPAYHVGVDFTKAIQNFFVVGSRELLYPRKEIVLYHFPRDFVWSLRHGELIGIFAWLIREKKRWKTFPFYDRKLFQAHFCRLWKSCIRIFVEFFERRVTIRSHESFDSYSDV